MTERTGDRTTTVAVQHLCDALVGECPREAKAYVDRLVACGVSVEALYDSYLPRAAARLGELWVDDRLSFTAVTLGMGRLTDVFRSLSPLFMKARKPILRGRRALFALVPGEEHSFGVVMAADHFQRAGWTVQVELRASLAQLEDLVATQPYELVGLSVGSRRMVPGLERCHSVLRAAARKGTRFALGGALIRMEPELVAHLGADIDAGGAVKRTLYDMELRV